MKKIKLCRKTEPIEVTLKNFAIAPIDTNRIRDLAEVFVSGYEGTVDYEGETVEDGEKYMYKIFNNEFGEFLETYSWSALDKDDLVGTCIVLLHRKLKIPFVAFLVTKKEYKRQGIGKALLLKSMDSLYRDSVDEITLFVTDTNYPAIDLYKKLGFA